MTSDTQELVRISEQLPEDERAEVADFARFLFAKHEDEAWERAIADPEPRPKLDELVHGALAEGSDGTRSLTTCSANRGLIGFVHMRDKRDHGRGPSSRFIYNQQIRRGSRSHAR